MCIFLVEGHLRALWSMASIPLVWKTNVMIDAYYQDHSLSLFLLDDISFSLLFCPNLERNSLTYWYNDILIRAKVCWGMPRCRYRVEVKLKDFWQFVPKLHGLDWINCGSRRKAKTCYVTIQLVSVYHYTIMSNIEKDLKYIEWQYWEIWFCIKRPH